MNKFRIPFVCLAAVACLALSIPAAAQGNRQSQPVENTNTPVPVQGTVAVSGTPSVSIANTVRNPVLISDVHGEVRSPFQFWEYYDFTGETGTKVWTPIPPSSAYSRAEIRQLSISVVSDTEGYCHCWLSASWPRPTGEAARAPVYLALPGTRHSKSFYSYQITLLLHLFQEIGKPLDLGCAFLPLSGESNLNHVNVNYSIAGYFVQ